MRPNVVMYGPAQGTRDDRARIRINAAFEGPYHRAWKRHPFDVGKPVDLDGGEWFRVDRILCFGHIPSDLT